MRKQPLNRFTLTFESRSVNEGFARLAASGFAAQLDPTVEELCDIKTAVSEAVTNCIVHAYPDGLGEIRLIGEIFAGGLVRFRVKDKGRGIEDIALAMQPLIPALAVKEQGSGLR